MLMLISASRSVALKAFKVDAAPAAMMTLSHEILAARGPFHPCFVLRGEAPEGHAGTGRPAVRTFRLYCANRG